MHEFYMKLEVSVYVGDWVEFSLIDDYDEYTIWGN